MFMNNECEGCQTESGNRRDRRIIFIGLGNRLPKDPIFDQVFEFLGIDRENIAVFTRIGGGGVRSFMQFLEDHPETFSLAVLLFLNKGGDIDIPDNRNCMSIPIPWEAFTIFEDGRFVRILERDDEIVARSLEEWAKWEDTLA